ncbi:MAG TPA: DNA ligase D, partial [Xanthomonadaceae bacterium]|nr:DNA ligase D [Xanthomonadaceae bacterium]
DFRLEVDGVLRSWSVPKGPSFRLADKRLAVEVEDHPLEYGSCEGVIPQGNYGAGHVAIFDRGTWKPIDEHADAAAAIKAGKLEFDLFGERLKGRWKLIRTAKQASKPQWLLFKRTDEYAGDAEADDLLDGLSLPTAAAKKPVARSRGNGGSWRDRAASLSGARPVTSPDWAPMLCASQAVPPAGDDWLHEVKWDGYRLLASVHRGNVDLRSRNGLPWNDKLPALVRALQQLGHDELRLDGELVSLDARGISDFNALQRALMECRTASLHYTAFDLTAIAGIDLSGVALAQRKALLQDLIGKQVGMLRYSDHQQGHGAAVFAAAKEAGLEGIISKRAASVYHAGRSRDWLKIKATETREYVVVGFTEPKGSRGGLGALLLARPDDAGGLVYSGRVGSGLNDAQLTALRADLESIAQPQGAVAISKHAFVRSEKINWVRPERVVEVIFRGWGKEGLLRQASFHRLRPDRVGDIGQIETGADQMAKAPATGTTKKSASGSATSAKTTGVTGTRKSVPIAGASVPAAPTKRPASSANPEPTAHPTPPARRVRKPVPAARVEIGELPKLSSPDKIVYPDSGITKQDVFDYYLAVAPRMLPELRGRLLSIVRLPDGMGGQTFFQKHLGRGFSKALKELLVTENDGDREKYFYVDDVAGLMGLVQMNALEFHPWGSTVAHLEKPDRLVFDLDPDPAVSWTTVRNAAHEVRARLLEVGLESFPRVTGGKGAHVVVPLKPVAEWAQVRAFAEAFAHAMTEQSPDRYLATMSKAKRVGKIFIDWLRNGRGATSVASWSLRARPGAPVCVPLTWEEFARIRKPNKFGPKEALQQAAKGEPWDIGRATRQTLPR